MIASAVCELMNSSAGYSACEGEPQADAASAPGTDSIICVNLRPSSVLQMAVLPAT